MTQPSAEGADTDPSVRLFPGELGDPGDAHPAGAGCPGTPRGPDPAGHGSKQPGPAGSSGLQRGRDGGGRGKGRM